MLENQRRLYDIPDNVAYLNCAYMSPLSRAVVAAMAAGVQTKVQPWTYGPADFFTYSEQARDRFSKLINGSAEDIAIVPAASYGTAIAANALPLNSGEEVLLLADQFPSNVYPWREKAKQANASVRTVARPQNGDWTPAILAEICERTAIIALPNCHWTDGGLIDLVRVGQAARQNGAALVLDLTQSLGALPFDVTAVQPDLMVCSGYKWLMGPYTLSYLYVSPRWQDTAPLEHNWIDRKGSEDFSRLVDYQDDYQPGARRFDMGERANPSLLGGSIAALDHLLGWTPEKISQALGARTNNIAARAEKLGLTSGPADLRAPHFLGLGFPGGIPKDLLPELARRNVFVSVRGASLRVTPHLYNTDADIDLLFEALEAVL